MDKEVISAKLESLRRCIQRIQDKTPDSPALLLEDKAIITSRLEDFVGFARAVAVSADLP